MKGNIKSYYCQVSLHTKFIFIHIKISIEISVYLYGIIYLFSDLTKFNQYLKNVAKTVLKLNNDKALSESIAVISKLKEEGNFSEETIKLINDTLASILTQYPRLSSDHDRILEQVLSGIIDNENSINRHEYYKKYLKLLYKTEKFDKLFSEAIKMHNIFSQDVYPLGNL